MPGAESEVNGSSIAEQNPVCPSCGSKRVVHNGFRKLSAGNQTQVFKCCDCEKKFQEKYIRFHAEKSKRQLCVILQDAKKLENITEIKTVMGDEESINGKVAEFLYKLEKSGYAKETRRLTATCLKVLVQLGATLSDPESVKAVLANSLIQKRPTRTSLGAAQEKET